MQRLEALRHAMDMVDKMSAPVTNARGYPADGYKGPTWAERQAAVMEIAAFLEGQPSDSASGPAERPFRHDLVHVRDCDCVTDAANDRVLVYRDPRCQALSEGAPMVTADGSPA